VTDDLDTVRKHSDILAAWSSSAPGHPSTLQRHIHSCHRRQHVSERVVDNGPWRPRLPIHYFSTPATHLATSRDGIPSSPAFFLTCASPQTTEALSNPSEKRQPTSPRARANSCQFASTSITCFQRDRRSGLRNNRNSERNPLDRLIRFRRRDQAYKHPHIWTSSAARHRYPNAKQDQGHFRVSTSQIATLEQLLKSVARVLMIGWRAREARFLPMLRDNLPRRGRGVSPCSRSERRRRPPNAHSVRKRSRVSAGPSLHCRRRLQPVCRQPRRRSLPAGLATT